MTDAKSRILELAMEGKRMRAMIAQDRDDLERLRLALKDVLRLYEETETRSWESCCAEQRIAAAGAVLAAVAERRKERGDG